jgi:magnesium chelatase family protein
MHVDVPAPAPHLLARAGQGEPSSAVRDRVARARAAQRERAGARGVRCNARLKGAALRRHCALDDSGRQLLTSAVERLGLSARAHDRILRLARTIADLAGAAGLRAEHVAEAIQYRALDRQA